MAEDEKVNGEARRVLGNIRFNGTGFYGDNGELVKMVEDGVLTNEQIAVAQEEYMDREVGSALFMVRATGIVAVRQYETYKKALNYGLEQGLITQAEIDCEAAKYSGGNGHVNRR
jgi:hypothetical protein